jgi:hypothetical protein
MLWAAGEQPPRSVFGHGFVNIKNEETGEVEKISKSIGNVVEPMDIITNFTVTEYRSDVFRYYFMRECPFPGDGDFSFERFAQVYDAALAHNLGNLYSRAVKLISGQGGRLAEPARLEAGAIYKEVDIETTVKQVQEHVEACQYNQALQRIWSEPVARSRIGCPVIGMTNIVVMSNDTSTGAVSTKNADTGRVGSGVRQRWRPGPSRSPTSHAGHITTCSSSAHATSHSWPIGNGQA